MPPPKPLKADKLIADIHKASGNLAAVARAYGISRQAVWEFVQRHPTCKAAWEDERQSMVDVAESSLKARVLAGDTTAIIFTLKTQGKERGYVERVEQTGKGGGPIETTSKHEHSFDYDAYQRIFDRVMGCTTGESGSGQTDPRNGHG